MYDHRGLMHRVSVIVRIMNAIDGSSRWLYKRLGKQKLHICFGFFY